MSEKIRLTPRGRSRLPEADRQDVTRFCPGCGREIPLDRQVCAFCENTGAIPRPRLSRKMKLLILAGVIILLLVLLFGLDCVIRGAGPLSEPTAVPPMPLSRGTPIPVTLMP